MSKHLFRQLAQKIEDDIDCIVAGLEAKLECMYKNNPLNADIYARNLYSSFGIIALRLLDEVEKLESGKLKAVIQNSSPNVNSSRTRKQSVMKLKQDGGMPTGQEIVLWTGKKAGNLGRGAVTLGRRAVNSTRARRAAVLGEEKRLIDDDIAVREQLIDALATLKRTRVYIPAGLEGGRRDAQIALARVTRGNQLAQLNAAILFMEQRINSRALFRETNVMIAEVGGRKAHIGWVGTVVRAGFGVGVSALNAKYVVPFLIKKTLQQLGLTSEYLAIWAYNIVMGLIPDAVKEQFSNIVTGVESMLNTTGTMAASAASAASSVFSAGAGAASAVAVRGRGALEVVAGVAGRLRDISPTAGKLMDGAAAIGGQVANEAAKVAGKVADGVSAGIHAAGAAASSAAEAAAAVAEAAGQKVAAFGDGMWKLFMLLVFLWTLSKVMTMIYRQIIKHNAAVKAEHDRLFKQGPVLGNAEAGARQAVRNADNARMEALPAP